MLLAVDVDYRGAGAHVAGVSFSRWEDAQADQVHLCDVEAVSAYESGRFYLREMPCILRLLETGLGLIDFQRDDYDAVIRPGNGIWPGLETIKLFDESVTPMCCFIIIRWTMILKRQPGRRG